LPLKDDLKDHSPMNHAVDVKGEVRIEDGQARFPGDGNFLELPHISLRRKEFSVSMWVKATGTNKTFSLFSQKEADKCGSALYLQVRNFSQLYMGFWANDVTAPTLIDERGDWNHLVFQYDRWRQQIWLNGQLLVERVTEPLEAKSGTCRVGGQPPDWTGHHDLDGWMRDFRIYDRPLAHDEIQQLASPQYLLAMNRSDANISNTREFRIGLETLASAASAAEAIGPRPFLQISGNQLTINGPPVQVYDLQATTDLNLDWLPVATLTNTTGAVGFVDEEAIFQGRRFYRVELIRNSPISNR